MKTLTIFVFIFCVFRSFGQTPAIVNSDNSVPEILSGQEAKLHLIAKNEDLIKVLNEKDFEIHLKEGKNDYYLEKGIVSVIDKDQFDVVFDCPKFNNLIGRDRTLILRKKDGKEWSIKIHIYALKPGLRDAYISNNTETTKISYTDLGEYQDLTLKFDNALYVNKISFLNENIELYSSTDRTITIANPEFRINEAENTISLRLRVKPDANFQCKIGYYEKGNPNLKENLEDLPMITFRKKYLGKSFSIAPVKIYADDFLDEPDNPKFKLKLNKEGNFIQNGDQVDISVDGITTGIKNIPIIISGSDDKTGTFYEDKEIEIRFKSPLLPGNYEVTATKGLQKQKGQFTVIPEPKIESISLSATNIIRKVGTSYELEIKGTKLEDMRDLEIELFNREPLSKKYYPITKDVRLQKNKITATINFQKEEDFIDVGEYQVRLKRQISNGSLQKVYPSDTYFKVIFPQEIAKDQTSLVHLQQYTDELTSLNARFQKRSGDKLLRIIKKDNPLYLVIDPSEKIKESGPQFLDVQLTYIKSDGSIVKVKLADDNLTSLQIKDKIQMVRNLKDPDLLDIKGDLGVNERIIVSVQHAKSYDGYTSSVKTYTFAREVNFGDRIGITATIPPYLISMRKVKGKTITKDADGNITKVEYDGEKSFQAQSLIINAGLGLKYRFKDRNYYDSPFAISTYLMGLNFASPKSRKEQDNDPENHDFIASGSFNMLVLGEYAIRNLDLPNARIPIYFGGVIVFNPLDGGSKLAPVLGLGVEIKFK